YGEEVRILSGSIRRLIALARESGAVREAVRTAAPGFRSAMKRIVMIAHYKAIHDQLHKLQMQCYDHLARDSGRFFRNVEAIAELDGYVSGVEEVLARLERHQAQFERQRPVDSGPAP